MAELTTNPPRAPWTSRQTAAQFGAIAWLRWRILLNGFRRKGGTGELVGRVVTYPMIAVVALFPTIGAGIAAWYFAQNGNLSHIAWLLWITFVLGQLLNINLGRTGTTFDPNELIRFPVRLREFVAIRLFFGLLAPSNVLVSVMSLSMAVGATIALPSLWLPAFLSLAVFAAANVLFTRMVFAWVDRWLSTRRAREIFTVLIFTLSLGFQWVNVTFNPAYNHHHRHAVSQQRITLAMNLYHHTHPYLVYLPPELSGSALVAAHQHQPLASLADILGTALYAAAFFFVFALRMRTEFRGEVLSDVANAVAPTRKTASASALAASSSASSVDVSTTTLPLRSAVRILFAKEILYVRRNIGLLYGLAVPVVMVFLFAGRLSLRGGQWILPGAIAYTLLSIMPISYNSFGLEGVGVQLYFLAPIRLRDVFIAKNLLCLFLAFIEMIVILVLIAYMTGRPPFVWTAITLLWGFATLFVGVTVGNLRSISAPKRIEFTRAAGKQASSLSAIISMGVLLVLAVIGAALVFGARLLHVNWLLLPVFAALFALALLIYLLSLKQLEQFTLNHREELTAVLAKAA